MTPTQIDQTDHQTGRVVDVPPDVLAVVERANAILQEQLQPISHLPIHTVWCRFEEHPSLGWMVSLHVFTDEYSFGQQMRVDDLRNPAAAKDRIRDVLWEFGQTISVKVGEQIRQIRADLKQMLAVGSH